MLGYHGAGVMQMRCSRVPTCFCRRVEALPGSHGVTAGRRGDAGCSWCCCRREEKPESNGTPAGVLSVVRDDPFVGGVSQSEVQGQVTDAR